MRQDIIDVGKPGIRTAYKVTTISRMERVYDCLLPSTKRPWLLFTLFIPRFPSLVTDERSSRKMKNCERSNVVMIVYILSMWQISRWIIFDLCKIEELSCCNALGILDSLLSQEQLVRELVCIVELSVTNQVWPIWNSCRVEQ